MAMALLTECREWMTKAISRIDDASAGSRQEMIIQSALASLHDVHGWYDRRGRTRTGRKRAFLPSASTTPNASSILCLFLWAHRIRLSKFMPKATELADRCGDVADGERRSWARSQRPITCAGVTYHHIGRILQAEAHFELFPASR